MQEIQDLERKKTYLKLGLVAAAIPALPGILISKLEALAKRAEAKLFPLKDQKPQVGKPLSSDERLLPPDHPLAQMVITEARKQGFATAGVFLEDADRPFSNAAINNLGKDQNGKENLTIEFTGNPLAQENGQALARGVIGHELGHMKTSSSFGLFRKYGLETADIYSKTGKGTMLVAVVGKVASVAGPLLLAPSPVHQRILDAAGHLASAGPLLATTALATGTMAYLTRRLIQSHAHATEHIADLHGAENTSPQDVTGVLAYLERQREEMRVETPPREKTLREIFHAAVHPEEYTHPSPESRISLLKKAFQGEGATPPVWAGQPGAMVGALAEKKPDFPSTPK